MTLFLIVVAAVIAAPFIAQVVLNPQVLVAVSAIIGVIALVIFLELSGVALGQALIAVVLGSAGFAGIYGMLRLVLMLDDYLCSKNIIDKTRINK